MLVSELLSGAEVQLLPKSKIWERDISKVTRLDIRVFIRRNHDSKEAIAEAQMLLDKAFNHAISNYKVPPKICFFKPVQERITVDELVSWLSVVSETRRKALLFALETGMDVREVIELTWKDVPGLRNTLSEFANGILHGMVRHFKLPYVFWEANNNADLPLFGLSEDAEEVANGHGFSGLRAMYKNMIMIDQKQERIEFLEHAMEFINNR